ncbi:NADPH-flavin oxidoreductase, partial [Psychromonas sp. PRT-SC03]
VYIGGLRNNAKAVDDLLFLPQYTAVLFGMCLGHPAQSPECKPRLSPNVIVHENSYHALENNKITDYDDIMKNYYATRSTNQKQSTWSSTVTDKLSIESRPHMKDYLLGKGLSKK